MWFEEEKGGSGGKGALISLGVNVCKQLLILYWCLLLCVISQFGLWYLNAHWLNDEVDALMVSVGSDGGVQRGDKHNAGGREGRGSAERQQAVE